jgi:hypothetical protein
MTRLEISGKETTTTTTTTKEPPMLKQDFFLTCSTIDFCFSTIEKDTEKHLELQFHES